MKGKKIKFKDGSYYIGQLYFGVANGKGAFYDNYGAKVYEGTFINGLPFGEGVFIDNDKDSHTGTYYMGVKHGHIAVSAAGSDLNYKEGTFKLGLPENDFNQTEAKSQIDKMKELFETSKMKPKAKFVEFEGGKYYGSLKSGKPHGVGVYISDNGNKTYLGKFKNGLMHGKGILCDQVEKTTYQGFMQNNKKEIEGKIIFADGSYYVGNFKNERFEGNGTFYDKTTNTTFSGNYINGKKHGKFKVQQQGFKPKFQHYVKDQIGKEDGSIYGTLTNDEFTYEGYILNGKPHNEGKIVWHDKQESYAGTFNHGLMHGEGTYTFKDGNRREGGMHNNQFAGFGTVYEKNNNIVYKGDFLNGKFDGYGTRFYDNKTLITGQFKNGKPNGYLEVYDVQTQKIRYKGLFKDGKRDGFGVWYKDREYVEGNFTEEYKGVFFATSKTHSGLSGLYYQFGEANSTTRTSDHYWDYRNEAGWLDREILYEDLIEKDMLAGIVEMEKRKSDLEKRADVFDNITRNSYEYRNVLEEYLKEFDRIHKGRSTSNVFDNKFFDFTSDRPKEKDTKEDDKDKNKPNNNDKRDDVTIFEKDDASEDEVVKEVDMDAKFADYIGLEEVKEELKNIIALKQLQGDNYELTDMHMAFTGNAGTGKTTVARLFAEILYDNGIIQKPKLVEASFSSLYGAYVGHSLKAINEKINEAQGGILFIDEAHQLTTDASSGAQSSFNAELMNALITTLENKRNDILVIFAGYPKEMEAMLKKADKGLSSRISRVINFRDLNNEELLTVFKLMLSKIKNRNNKSFSLSKDAEKTLSKRINLDKIEAGDTFGNARDVRVLVRKVLEGFARISQGSKRTVIENEDLERIFAEDKNKKRNSDKDNDGPHFI